MLWIESQGSATTIITNPIWVVQTSEAVQTMHSRSNQLSVERPGVLQIIKNIVSKHGFRYGSFHNPQWSKFIILWLPVVFGGG